jgi:hypothetical protein
MITQTGTQDSRGTGLIRPPHFYSLPSQWGNPETISQSLTIHFPPQQSHLHQPQQFSLGSQFRQCAVGVARSDTRSSRNLLDTDAVRNHGAVERSLEGGAADGADGAFQGGGIVANAGGWGQGHEWDWESAFLSYGGIGGKC